MRSCHTNRPREPVSAIELSSVRQTMSGSGGTCKRTGRERLSGIANSGVRILEFATCAELRVVRASNGRAFTGHAHPTSVPVHGPFITARLQRRQTPRSAPFAAPRLLKERAAPDGQRRSPCAGG